MHTDEEANQLVKMPPLVNWEGSFKFTKWSPMACAFSPEFIHNLAKGTWVSFRGIPYHLRITSVVEVLAKACGPRWKIDEDSLNLSSKEISAIIFGVVIWKIPRTVYLCERGFKFPVLVNVNDVSVIENHGVTTETCRGKEFSDNSVIASVSVVGQVANVKSEHVRVSDMSRPPGFHLEIPQPHVSGFQNLNQQGQSIEREIQNLNLNLVDQHFKATPLEVSQNPFHLLDIQDDQPGEYPEEEEHLKDIGGDVVDQGENGPLIPIQTPRKKKKNKSPLRGPHIGNTWGPYKSPYTKYGAQNNSFFRPNRLWISTSRNSLSRGPRSNSCLARAQTCESLLFTPSHSGEQLFQSSSPSMVANTQSINASTQQAWNLLKPEVRKEIAIGLMQCEDDEQTTNWLRWFFIPFAKHLGMSTSLAIERQMKLFKELIEGAKSGTHEQNNRDQLVDHVN
ncbi:hypothetical protein FRX31_025640 [Thalictrum thalictroides]|uniref:DUF4283 domain-containing protein n=1 Tax=Thalictrum thalictroides TaxID=46969 RepID=A0A7J6VKB0_THATH|nr:hypothetical protein FRX31_025640 [Thalictrum thalictroides]